MAAGSISKRDFVHFSKLFLEHSNLVHDSWELRTCAARPNDTFLYKKSIVSCCHSKNCMDLTTMDEEILRDTTINEDDDNVCSSLPPNDFLTYEYHIVYSESYAVPVLYFNVYQQNGRLLPLDDVWSMVPEYYTDRLQEERWTFLTQQEHPLLGRPYYQLHPCHTADLQKQISGEVKGQGNYLVTWLSAVGPVVGLTLPTSYASICHEVT